MIAQYLPSLWSSSSWKYRQQELERIELVAVVFLRKFHASFYTIRYANRLDIILILLFPSYRLDLSAFSGLW
jgi:hypothetical protein